MIRNRFSDYFEGVCVLPSSWPPACVEGGVRASVLDTTSGTPVAPVAKFQKRRCCCYLRYFSTREVPKSGLPPNGTPHGPPGAQGAPNGPQRYPKTANGSPKAGQRGPESTQREPKGDQSRPKSVPMGSQRWPKTAKGSPGGPNYINKLPINRPSGRYVNLIAL